MVLKKYMNENYIEVGVDEVARGCIFGRVYAAAVILNNNIDVPSNVKIDDSKKLSKKQREKAYEYIINNAIDYGVGWVDEKYIDEHNILNASMLAMHKALNNLQNIPQLILVDGIHFKPHECIPHEEYSLREERIPYECIPHGDAIYLSIACASIIAKVEHDKYIIELCNEYPELNDYYNLSSNVGYCCKKHLNGIIEHGYSQYHRISFNIKSLSK